jgi:hypothetical protein
MTMFPRLSILIAALLLALPRLSPALDDGPPISISSPDVATTFAFGSIKNRSLFWSKTRQVLIARVTFTDDQQDSGGPVDDSHDFRLPGVTLDPAKGIFYATSPKGLVIPVARYKKTLFITNIEILPNAVVRVRREHGSVSVILEAISPDDPAMHPKPDDSDGTHQVDIKQLLQ